MPTPSPEIIQLMSVFAVAFTAPTFAKAMLLVYGTILAPGRRTVTAALRVLGLADDPHFTNFHRVLNRAEWSPWVLSRLLLSLIILTCLPADAPLLLVIDETLERRRGPKIRYKGWFRDAVRSTATHVVKALGLRWICLAVLVPVPWSQRSWALPFMLVLALSPKTNAQLKKPHRTSVGWAGFMIDRVRRWQATREIIVVGDGGYAAVALVRRCQRLKQPVKLVSRLRMDATLHDFPGPQPKSKRGPKPKKGARQLRLDQRLSSPDTVWQTITVPWYQGNTKMLHYITGTSLWYRRGEDPVPIRWVLVRSLPDDEAPVKPAAFFCSDTYVTPEQIIIWFISRWNIEVTFEELRAHLGFETQRQWSDRAIERSTPCLFGVFSVVVLMAKVLHPHELPIRQALWYPKDEATFSDALAAVRRHLWARFNSGTSSPDPDLLLFPSAAIDSLVELACYAG